MLPKSPKRSTPQLSDFNFNENFEVWEMSECKCYNCYSSYWNSFWLGFDVSLVPSVNSVLKHILFFDYFLVHNFKNNFIYLFIFGYAGFSLQIRLVCDVQASHCSGFFCGAQALGCMGFNSWSSWLLSMSSTVVVHGLSCCPACEIFPDRGWNPCLLHWQADSL